MTLQTIHSAWESALQAVGCRNVRAGSRPPDPMVSNEAVSSFLVVPDTPELEAWWVDRDELGLDTRRLRRVDGRFWATQEWQVFGLLYRVSDPPQPIADWYASYQLINDRLEQLTAWTEEHVNLDESGVVTVDKWDWDVLWHKMGEQNLWSGMLKATLTVEYV